MAEESKTPRLAKSFNNASEVYIRAAGGYEAYRKLIDAINPDAPEFNTDENKEFRTVANCLDHAFYDYDWVGTSSKPSGLILSSATDDIKFPVEKTFGGNRDFRNYVELNLRSLTQLGAHVVQPQDFKRWLEFGAPMGSYLVAMYAKPSKGDKPEVDFFAPHFIRQDKDGGWSGKFGAEDMSTARAASKLDEAGNPIVDPLTADIDGYQFVAFLQVPSQGLDVGAGPRYNQPGSGVMLPPEERRNLDEQIVPPFLLQKPGGGNR